MAKRIRRRSGAHECCANRIPAQPRRIHSRPVDGWPTGSVRARSSVRRSSVFTLGSILCGRADSLAFLVDRAHRPGPRRRDDGAGRTPRCSLRTAPKSELVAAMAWLSMPALIGPVVGPPLGGFIVTYFSWPMDLRHQHPDRDPRHHVLVTVFHRRHSRACSGATRFDFAWLAVLRRRSRLRHVRPRNGRPRRWSPLPLTCGDDRHRSVVLAGLGYFWVHARRHPAPLLDLRPAAHSDVRW